jgi:hypothetical protein
MKWSCIKRAFLAMYILLTPCRDGSCISSLQRWMGMDLTSSGGGRAPAAALAGATARVASSSLQGADWGGGVGPIERDYW